MTKEETIYTINKLLNQYKKRIQSCNEKCNSLYEQSLNEGKMSTNITELDELTVESNLLEEFESDLEKLLKDINA